MNEWMLIVGMMLVTFGVRYPVLALLSRTRLPEAALRALEFVPVAVLSAIVVPMAFIRDGEWAISFDNPFLLASIIAIFIAWISRNLLLTILLGMAVFLFLKWLL
jgi:branched-subunit amino acid transport protein